MKNGMKYLGGVLLISLFFSCGSKQAPDTKIEITQECLHSDDTIKIVQLTAEYLEHLKEKEFEEAMQMLHVIRNDSVFSLTDIDMEKMRVQYETFPVLAYQIKRCFINGFHETEVAYSIEFFKRIENDNRPNTLNFRLNPQKINNVWYLSLVTR